MYVGAWRSSLIRMRVTPWRSWQRKRDGVWALTTLWSHHEPMLLPPAFTEFQCLGEINIPRLSQGVLSQAAEPDPSTGLSFCHWDWSHSEYIQSLHGSQRVVHVATHFCYTPFSVPSINGNKTLVVLLLYTRRLLQCRVHTHTYYLFERSC